jgi:hypothetical protein
MQRKWLNILITVLLVSCTSKDQGKLIFSVMGDVPREASEDLLLQRQIAAHNQYSKSEFILHVGDIKTGSAPCAEEVYQRVAGFLKQIKVPTFIVVGDNEWNDCVDPDQAWIYWHQYFNRFEENWHYGPPVQHQPGHEENFAWTTHHVRMIGINLVGGRIHDPYAWEQMLRTAADWTALQLRENRDQVAAAVVFAQANPKEKHALFMNQFVLAVEQFRKPVLFIHGDGHRWLYEHPWLKPNLLRVQVDQGAIAVPLQVMVDVQGDSTFAFNRTPFTLAE